MIELVTMTGADDSTDINEMIEIQREFVDKFSISHDRVYLMPESTNKHELQEKSKWVAELCKENGFNYSTRLQIDIWNQTTGV